MAKTFKGEIVDAAILCLEEELKQTGKHLIKTETILELCGAAIDLTDESKEREELLEIGMRQVIQSRLYVHNYFSVERGYFVNIIECENLRYLGLIENGKNTTIEIKNAALNRIKEIKKLNGQGVFIPGENNELECVETLTKEELLMELEADAI